MKHLKLLTASAVLSFSLLTSCQKENDALVSAPSTTSSSQLATLPAGSEDLKANSGLLAKADPQYRDMVRRATAIQPTPCDSNTPLNLWLDQQLKDWTSLSFAKVNSTAMLDLPTYDALLFENSSANQYFGQKGEYTQRLTKTFKDLQRFWNIQSQDIVLAAMHGNMLQDRTKLIRTYKAAFGLSDASAAFYADRVLTFLKASPEMRNGTHPIFTFNAFAQEGFDFPPYGTIPSKIIMGDGIMEAYTALGYDDVAPQAILAHEFGHQVQFQLGLFTNENTPEATRRTELMADAYSAYYLSHARGASMQWKRVRQFLQVFFNIGDCQFSSTGHHGTPTQRIAAAEFGYNTANDAQKQGHILTAQEFTKLFEAQLPAIVKL
ncbi:neutral zinc metallopeptidase [Hymenobacter jejuensis]|uniref:Uncharacterized protein n=1 Tax=Hymenobacter jejuensis TaxID=2502781 RepID=A0A5B7ZYM5_9BACT|nr:hypothetical protein [Hymenobacter jejuensis]QDA60118.1 hypothetical protein FHG12_08355 [Hymenobacter jejuensis]